MARNEQRRPGRGGAAVTSLAGDYPQRSKIDPKTPAAIWCGRLPVRKGLQPKPRRPVPCREDVPPDLLQRYPDVLLEVNAVHADVWRDDGMSRPDWDGCKPQRIWLDEALDLPVEGKA
jgi:hypothetical protein